MKTHLTALLLLILSACFISCEDWAEYENRAVQSARSALILSKSNVINLQADQWKNFPVTNAAWQSSDFDQWKDYASLSADDKVLWIQFSKPQEFDKKITVRLDRKSLKPLSVSW